MGVLKSCSRTSSPHLTKYSLVHDGVTSDLTSGPDMSTPSEAAPRGWGSGMCQSLKRAFYWLLFLPPTCLRQLSSAPRVYGALSAL